MSTFELLGRRTYYKESRQRIVGLHIQSGSVFLTVVTILLATSLSILYFLQINAIAKKGLTISAIEKKLKTIKNENRILANEIDNAESLQETNRLAQDVLRMKSVGSIVYMNNTSSNRVLARNVGGNLQ